MTKLAIRTTCNDSRDMGVVCDRYRDMRIKHGESPDIKFICEEVLRYSSCDEARVIRALVRHAI